MMSDRVEDWEDDGHVCQECERLRNIVETQEDALKEFHAEIERLELALIHEEQEAVWGTLEADDE